jgi:hypothetical protein
VYFVPLVVNPVVSTTIISDSWSSLSLRSDVGLLEKIRGRGAPLAQYLGASYRDGRPAAVHARKLDIKRTYFGRMATASARYERWEYRRRAPKVH